MPNTVDSVDKVAQEIREWTLKQPQPHPNQMVPPLGGQLAIPHLYSFNSIVNLISRTYSNLYDAALLDCPENAAAMLGDAVVAEALDSRMIPVCQLEWHLEAQDESDPKQMAAVASLTQVINDIPNLLWYKRCLLLAIWYGRCAVQNIFAWDYSRGYKRLVVRDWTPVIGDKMVFKFDNTPGILVHATYPGAFEMTLRGRAHFFHGQERQVLAVHHFQPSDADFYDYNSAGAIMGIGLRASVYWYWKLKALVFANMMEYLQRTAFGFVVWFYEQGNPESLAEVTTAAQNAVSGNAILFPRKADGTGPGVEFVQPGLAGADLFRSLITNYFDDIIRLRILGQTLTTGTAGTGMGSGVAEAHQSTQENITNYDAAALAESITRELVTVLCRWNHPNVPCPKFVFDVDKPNVAEYMEAAQMLYEMGVTIDADDLRAVTGLPKPEPNHEVISRMVPEQPATIGQPAAGQPVEAAAGGAPQGQPVPEQGQPQVAGPPEGAVVRQSRLKKAMVQLARRKRAAILRKTGGSVNGNGKRS